MNLRRASLILSTLLVLSSLKINAQTGNNPPTSSQLAITGTNGIPEPKAPGKNFTNFVGMELIQVPDGFWAGKFEVTQAEFQKVTGVNPSAFVGELRPVDNVTWNEAVEFCKKLTDLDLKKKKLPEGYYYTLPTESEWTNIMADATLDSAVTSLNGNIRSETSPVGNTIPNGLGLYDMRGNVMEFVLSDESKPFRFLKGGSWQDRTEDRLRPEFRWYCQPDERLNAFGFRCLLKQR
jgi:formylglycine-generating enzyme required for sulfatase activity